MKKLILVFVLGLLGQFVLAQPVLDFLGQKTYSGEGSDIWGYAANGQEYALMGLTNGYSIVDVTDPTNPNELHFVPGSWTYWRDFKTYGTYAYLVNEAGGGLEIIDLSGLPGSISSNFWTGGSFQGNNYNVSTVHNIFIDENGIGYLVGGNFAGGGALMIDIAANPTNPSIVGVYSNEYVHDIYVRGDTMWNAEVYEGRVAVFDISDKTNPVQLGAFFTPNYTAHNCWLSNDGNYMFTTDETSGGKVGIFDVSNLNNVSLIDTYLPDQGTGAFPHNTFVHGNYLYTAYYSDGVTVADISDPTNLFEVDAYDTAPGYSGGGFNGAWGVYPYLPSGNVLVADIEQGLYILGDPNGGQSSLGPAEVSLKVYLEGPYLNNGTMDARLGSLIPLNQPYNDAPYNYTGTETLTSVPPSMIDWVLVEARTGTPSLSGSRNTTTVETQAAILLASGAIVGTDGTPLKFQNFTEGDDYYFCVRHRNHLDVLSATSITGAATMAFDFTTNSSKALGTAQLQTMADGKAAMFAGEYNVDGSIQNTDKDTWRVAPAILNDYNYNDGNLDGAVQVTDYDTWYPNRAKIGIAEINF